MSGAREVVKARAMPRIGLRSERPSGLLISWERVCLAQEMWY